MCISPILSSVVKPVILQTVRVKQERFHVRFEMMILQQEVPAKTRALFDSRERVFGYKVSYHCIPSLRIVEKFHDPNISSFI